MQLDLNFKEQLIPKDYFSEEMLKTFLEDGYAIIQLIEGEQFIKITSKYFEELGEMLIKYPQELCIDYWKRLVDETKNCGIMVFIEQFCFVHTSIKNITDGEVDFAEVIGGQISGEISSRR